MNSTTWLVLGSFILVLVLAFQGNSSARGRSSNSDDDDDDDDPYKQIQDQMEEDHLYRLWQDSDY